MRSCSCCAVVWSLTLKGGSRAVLAWLAVGLPLAWGTYKTLLSAAKFFQ